jgi:hypothetical protein
VPRSVDNFIENEKARQIMFGGLLLSALTASEVTMLKTVMFQARRSIFHGFLPLTNSKFLQHVNAVTLDK